MYIEPDDVVRAIVWIIAITAGAVVVMIAVGIYYLSHLPFHGSY